jgi:hypothetical protein
MTLFSEDEIIQKELEGLVEKNEASIEELEKHLGKFRHLESEFKNSNIDWNSLAHKVKDFEETKDNIEYFNMVKRKNEFIDKIIGREEIGDLHLIEVLQDMLGIIQNQKFETISVYLESKIWFECLNKISTHFKVHIEKVLIEMKFPIFEGFSSHQILGEFKKNHIKEYEEFNLYFEILEYILKSQSQNEFENKLNHNHIQLNTEEIFFLFLLQISNN